MHELSATATTSWARLAHWRSTSGFEVDFILGDHTASRLRPTGASDGATQIVARARGEARLTRSLFVSLEPGRRRVSDVTVEPIQAFLTALWDGEYR
jgi:uncharacterized protein